MKTNYFNRIFGYAWVFKKYFILNILSNIFYAFFGTLSMISLFPMLKVLFNQTEQLNNPPVWRGMSEAANYVENYLHVKNTKKIESRYYFLKALGIRLGQESIWFNSIRFFFLPEDSKRIDF